MLNLKDLYNTNTTIYNALESSIEEEALYLIVEKQLDDKGLEALKELAYLHSEETQYLIKRAYFAGIEDIINPS